MNKKLDIKNPRFRLVDSTLKGCKEVEVVFNYNGEDYKYFIFVDEDKNTNYINEAKKQFNQDVKSGEVLKSIKPSVVNRRPWLIAGASALGVAAITFAALFTWKALTNGGGDVPPEPDPSNCVTLTLDAGEGNTIEGTTDKISKYYVKKGSTFIDVFKNIHYVGGASKDKDFLYWTINNQPINEDYVINEDINLVPVYKPIQTDCLTITAREDNLFMNFIQKNDLQISTDHENWNSNVNVPIVLEHAGDQVYVKRQNESALNSSIISSSNKPHSISGPIESLVNDKTTELVDSTFKNCFLNDSNLTSANNLNLGNITLTSNCYYNMFEGCSSLITVPELPATTLANSCYYQMFSGCSSLTTAPALPATTLANNCYQSMFSGCSSLTTAPALPAETLANYCYQSMFSDCSSLTTAPALPATTLANNCYQSMFSGCSSLTTAPELPAETLATSCYSSMFYECSSLTTAPALPATTLVGSCYYQMFDGCSSLTTAPALPAEALAVRCYQSMFFGCSSLTTAPALPARTLANNCYYQMFSDCSSLTTAPALPAETLANYCYQSMFSDCSSLTTAPELPATTLANYCYQNMFYGCSSLEINENGSGTKIFTCPSTIPSLAVNNMFQDTAGTFTGTPTAGNTYYWYIE